MKAKARSMFVACVTVTCLVLGLLSPASGSSQMGGDNPVSPMATPVPNPDDYEPDDAMHEATYIAPNGPSQNHNFHAAGDEDWVKFEAWAGDVYTIRTFDLDFTCDTVLGLYNAQGEKLAENDDEGVGLGGAKAESQSLGSWASRIYWEATEDGSYYVRVSQYNPAVGSNLKYSLEVTKADDGYEPDDALEDAMLITVGAAPQDHNFDSPGDDEDWVKFEATAATTYTIRTLNLTGGNDTTLSLYDGDSTLLASNDDYQDNSLASQIDWTAPADGTYYVKAAPFELYSGGGALGYQLEVILATDLSSPSAEEEERSISDQEAIDHFRNTTLPQMAQGEEGPLSNLMVVVGETVYPITDVLAHMEAQDEIGKLEIEVEKTVMRREERGPSLHVIDAGRKDRQKMPAPWNTYSTGPAASTSENITVVVQRPDWGDTACYWGQYWMENDIAQPAREVVPTVVDLYGDDATRDNVLAAIKDAQTVYFSGLGHGNTTTFTGQRKGRVFWKGDEETKAISKGNHFNFLSCEFGEAGCPWMVAQGALGVHGYDESFIFVIDRQNYPDGYAEGFFDSHAAVERALLAGQTHGEAHQACLDRFEHWIQNAPSACTRYLIWDQSHKVFYGDPDSCPFDYTPDDYEPDDTMHEATPIEVNGSSQDRNFHAAGDEDWVKFWAWAGDAYTIRTFDLGGGNNTTLRLYNAQGEKLAENDDDPDNPPASKIEWVAPADGSYFARVALPKVELDSTPPTYSLEVTKADDDYEPDNTLEDAKPIAVNGAPQDHTFHSPGDDEDWVKFEALADAVYTLRTLNLTRNNDTTLYLYDKDSHLLASNDDYQDNSAASEIEWTAPADGMYYAQAKPFTPWAGGCNLGYQLEVVCGTPGQPHTLALEAHPTSLLVGETSVLTATVKDLYGNAVADGAAVNFDTDLGCFETDGNCEDSITTTTTSGLATAQLTSTETGTATVTATADSICDTATVTFTPGVPYWLILKAKPSKLAVGETSDLTAAVSDQHNNPVADGTVVTLTTSLGSLEGDGNMVTITTTDGMAAAQLASTEAGTAIITATSNSKFDTATVEFTSGDLDHFAFDTIPNQTAGIPFSITVTAQDGYNNTVTAYAGINALSDSTGTISPTSTGSFTNGVWTGDVTITRAAKGVTIATTGDDSSGISSSFKVNPASPCTVTVTASRYAIPADGLAASTIIAEVTDQYGNNVRDGTVVTFTTTAGILGSDTVTETTKSTVDGVATATLTSTTTPQLATVTATADGKQGQTDVIFYYVERYVVLKAKPSKLAVGETSDLTAAVENQYGSPAPDGTLVDFATDLGCFKTDGSCEDSITLATTDGEATAQLTSTEIGTATITATSGAASDTVPVIFTAGQPHTLTLAAEPEELLVGETSDLTATVVDEGGNNVADGTEVDFATDFGCFKTDGGCEASITLTTTNSLATARLTATEVCTATVIATSDSVSDTAAVAFTIGPPYTVTLKAKPTSLPVGETSDLTAKVVDKGGNNVADGTVVVFITNLGTFVENGGRIYGTTTTGGAATAELTADEADTATVTAIAGAASGTQPITFGPSAYKVYLPLVLKNQAPPNQPPYAPSAPTPADDAEDQMLDVDLIWIGGDHNPGDTVTYDVYFGTTCPPSDLVGDDVSSPMCDPGPLDRDTLYYWYVVAKDNHDAESRGPEEGCWSFTTFLCLPPAVEPACDWCEPNNWVDRDKWGPLCSGTSYEAYLCSEDPTDYYYIDLAIRHHISVDLDVPNGVDYDLYLYDSLEEMVDWSYNAGSAAEHIEYDPLSTGRYYVRVHPFQGCSGSKPYILTAIYE